MTDELQKKINSAIFEACLEGVNPDVRGEVRKQMGKLNEYFNDKARKRKTGIYKPNKDFNDKARKRKTGINKPNKDNAAYIKR